MKAFSRMVHASSNVTWFLPRTQFDYSAQIGKITGSSVAMAAVMWIMRNFPEAPLMLLDTEDEPVYDHAMLDLWRRPNPYYSGLVLESAMAASFTLDGNAYGIKVRGRQLEVKELWYVPHWMIDPMQRTGSDNFIDYYKYQVNGKTIELLPEDVIHFRFGLDPHNVRKGLSPFKTLMREIFTDDEGANFTASLLRNSGIPGVVISPDSDSVVGDQQLTAVKEYIKSQFAGDKRGEPLALKARTKVEQFGFSPQQLDLSKLRRIPEERVSACTGIPAAVIGFGSGLENTKVGATMRELREQAYENGIIPMQRFMGDDIASQLLPDFEADPKKLKVAWDYSRVRVLQEDETQKAERTATLFEKGLITREHGKRLLGIESTPSDQVYRYPFNVVLVSENESTIPTPEPEPEPEPEAEPEDDKKSMKSVVPTKNEGWQQRLVTQFMKDEGYLAEAFEKELRPRFDAYGKRAAELFLESQKGAETETKIDLADKVLIAAVELKLKQETEVEVLLGYGAHYLKTAAQTVTTINAVIGLGVDLTAPMEVTVLERSGKRMGLIDLSAQTKEAMFNAIAEARELGEGPPAVAARIENQVAAGPWRDSRTRAHVIARTETKYAQNVSTLQAYKQSDTIGGVQIADGQLENSCEYCISIDGSIVSFADAEILAAEEHPNGTRSFTPVFGTPETVRVESQETFEAREG